MERMIKPFHSAGLYYSGDRFDVEPSDFVGDEKEEVVNQNLT